MKKNFMKRGAAQICWTRFSRKSDAVFLSLGKEIRIGILSVATLGAATPTTAAAMMATDVHQSVEADDADDSAYELGLAETEVVGTLAPLPADKAVRLVQVISRQEIEASSAQSVNDLLKLAAGVDVRQRGGFSIQTDIGVNGGNSNQLTVLLNGVNISNPQTGHHTVDLPVSIDDIERIEIIEGGASRVYGSQAFAGAINIVTRTEKESAVGAGLRGGSYGSLGADAHIAIKSSSLNNRVSGGHTRSDGAMGNDDFERTTAFWRGIYTSEPLDVKMQAGISSMDYGANTFYGTGSASQYEEERRYMIAAQGELKGKVHILPQAYWTRSLDRYVWTRSNPEAYQNFHQINVYGASVNAHTSWWLGKTAVGIEVRRENILSTRLGKEIDDGESHKVPGHDAHYKYKDGRTNIGVYLEHDVLVDNVTLSFGVLANKNSAVDGGMKLYPGVDVSWRVADGLKVYGSFNQSLRVPTFTDLYYYGPGLQGHADLKPEKSTDYNAGISFRNNCIAAQLKGFFRRGTDMIDWVRKRGNDVYTSDNCNIDSYGVEALASISLAKLLGGESMLQSLTLGYCYNYQQRKNVDEASAYASRLEFLRHKLTASLNHRIAGKLSAQWDFTLKSRVGEFDNALTGKPEKYGTFGNLDLKVQWTEKAWTLYLQGNNLTNHKYYDIANVLQPGLWLMGGAKINISL